LKVKKTILIQYTECLQSITGLGPNSKNTLKNYLNSCQIFWSLKLLTNIFNHHFYTSNKLVKPKHQLDNFSDLCDKNGAFKIFWLFLKISQIWEFLLTGPSPVLCSGFYDLERSRLKLVVNNLSIYRADPTKITQLKFSFVLLWTLQLWEVSQY
jgi:hypothetical protein